MKDQKVWWKREFLGMVGHFFWLTRLYRVSEQIPLVIELEV
jgi:hypothetical protein